MLALAASSQHKKQADDLLKHYNDIIFLLKTTAHGTCNGQGASANHMNTIENIFKELSLSDDVETPESNNHEGEHSCTFFVLNFLTEAYRGCIFWITYSIVNGFGAACGFRR